MRRRLSSHRANFLLMALHQRFFYDSDEDQQIQRVIPSDPVHTNTHRLTKTPSSPSGSSRDDAWVVPTRSPWILPAPGIWRDPAENDLEDAGDRRDFEYRDLENRVSKGYRMTSEASIQGPAPVESIAPSFHLRSVRARRLQSIDEEGVRAPKRGRRPIAHRLQDVFGTTDDLECDSASGSSSQEECLSAQTYRKINRLRTALKKEVGGRLAEAAASKAKEFGQVGLKDVEQYYVKKAASVLGIYCKDDSDIILHRTRSTPICQQTIALCQTLSRIIWGELEAYYDGVLQAVKKAKKIRIDRAKKVQGGMTFWGKEALLYADGYDNTYNWVPRERVEAKRGFLRKKQVWEKMAANIQRTFDTLDATKKLYRHGIDLIDRISYIKPKKKNFEIAQELIGALRSDAKSIRRYCRQAKSSVEAANNELKRLDSMQLQYQGGILKEKMHEKTGWYDAVWPHELKYAIKQISPRSA